MTLKGHGWNYGTHKSEEEAEKVEMKGKKQNSHLQNLHLESLQFQRVLASY